MPEPEDPCGGAYFARFRERLGELHEWLQPRTYLEIGVDEGCSLALANPETLAVGVDPAPSVEVELGPRTRVFAESSDEFFAGRDVAELFGGMGIDLALIDGLHLFEQALRDVFNVGHFLSPGGSIVLHDTLPYNAVVARRRRTTQKWTGDVWKVVEILRRERADLSLVTIDVPPTGLTLIRGLDPADPSMQDGYERVVARYLHLSYGAYQRARSKWHVVPDGDHVVPELVGSGEATPRSRSAVAI